MGFNLLKWIGDRVKELIIGLIDFIAYLVKQASKIVRWALHSFKEWIAGLISTWWGALIILVTTVILIIVAPSFFASAAGKAVINFFVFIQEMAKKGIDALFVFLHMKEVLAFSDILKIFWDDYAKAIEQLNMGISSLSEELGYGTGILTSYMRNMRTVIYAAGITVGAPKEFVEMQYMDSTLKALDKIDKDFYKYADSPEKFIKDIDMSVMYPFYDAASQNQTNIISTIENVIIKSNETVNNLRTTKEALDKLVLDLPDEIQAKVSANFGVLSDTIDNFDDKYIVPVQMQIQEVQTVLSDYNKSVQANNKRIEDKLNNFGLNIIDLGITNVAKYQEQCSAFVTIFIDGVVANIKDFLDTDVNIFLKPFELTSKVLGLPKDSFLALKYDRTPLLLPHNETLPYNKIFNGVY